MSNMRAWTFDAPAPIAATGLRIEERQRPEPAADEVVVKVRACGVCRTDLHLVEGDLTPRRQGVTPGHQVVGEVVAIGAGASKVHARMFDMDPVSRLGLRAGVGY